MSMSNERMDRGPIGTAHALSEEAERLELSCAWQLPGHTLAPHVTLPGVSFNSLLDRPPTDAARAGFFSLALWSLRWGTPTASGR